MTRAPRRADAVPAAPSLPNLSPHRNHLSDLRGASRLAVDATRGLADLVEAMHHTIGRTPGVLGSAPAGRTRGITGLVYRSVRGVTRSRGRRHRRDPRPARPPVRRQRAVTARAKRSSPRSTACSATTSRRRPIRSPIRLRFRRDGVPLPMERDALAASMPACSGKLLVLVHGLCLNDLQWNRRGHDHGAALARDLGYTPVYLHYNTGLHISTNGAQLADCARDAGAAMARAAPGFRDPRAQHGRPRGTQRVPLWRRGRSCVARTAPHARVPRDSASWRADGARRQLDRRAARRQPLLRAVRAAREDPQRRHHRPPLRQPRPRGLAGPRPLRARRPPALRAAAGGRALLHHRGDDCTRFAVVGTQAAGRRTRPGRERARLA